MLLPIMVLLTQVLSSLNSFFTLALQVLRYLVCTGLVTNISRPSRPFGANMIPSSSLTLDIELAPFQSRNHQSDVWSHCAIYELDKSQALDASRRVDYCVQIFKFSCFLAHISKGPKVLSAIVVCFHVYNLKHLASVSQQALSVYSCP
jgi:hypothetical protein